MNMPNLASCHHAMRASRVAACFWSAAVGAGSAAGVLRAYSPALRIGRANAAAPAAPNCFKNDRLVLSLHSIGASLALSQQDFVQQAHG